MLRHDMTAATISPPEPHPEFARMPSVLRFTKLGRSTIYRLMATKDFPDSVKLGPRAVGWRWTDLYAWSETRPQTSH